MASKSNLKFKIKNLKLFLILFSLFIFLLVNSPNPASAQSDYVLPYPSSMPGSIFYKPQETIDNLFAYWYFGDFGQFKYNLSQADKYLVEAKTLFDYKQYLLGNRALLLSSKYFAKIKPTLVKASLRRKNISEKQKILIEAVEKHIEELEKLKSFVPRKFEWVPEKESPTILNLEDNLNEAISIRQKSL